jgi:hypothetical protein
VLVSLKFRLASRCTPDQRQTITQATDDLSRSLNVRLTLGRKTPHLIELADLAPTLWGYCETDSDRGVIRIALARSLTGRRLYCVTAHELAHALGIPHTTHESVLSAEINPGHARCLTLRTRRRVCREIAQHAAALRVLAQIRAPAQL